MKLFVISDTHGKLGRVFDIWPKLKNIDLIVHAGDHYMDALRLQDELGVPVISVAGNCDSGRKCACEGEITVHADISDSSEAEENATFTYASFGDYGIIETEYGKLFLTHGHREHVNYDLGTLRYKALEAGCCMAIFGHTHRALNEETPDMRFLNPGSLNFPRDGSGGSYAIVRTSDKSLDASIVYYNTVMQSSGLGGSAVENHGGHGGAGTGEKSKVSDSGFLRSLFNYVDRF